MCKTTYKQSDDSQNLQLQKIQKLFIDRISHELRTPLTTILSSAELITSSYEQWSDEKILEYLGAIEQAALEFMDLLNNKDFEDNLRDFARENCHTPYSLRSCKRP